MLGPLAEPFLSGTLLSDDAEEGSRGDVEGLSDLWPRLSRVREGMEDLEASRTKVELARQLAVEQSNPESIAHAIVKVRRLPHSSGARVWVSVCRVRSASEFSGWCSAWDLS